MPKRLLSRSHEGSLLIKKFEITESFRKKQYSDQSLSEEEAPVVHIKNKRGKSTDFLVGDTVLLVISEKAKVFFEANIEHSNIEFLPVDMQNYGGKGNFWVMNVLEVIDCFDWDNSEYTLFDEPAPDGSKAIDEFMKVVLREQPIGEREIFYTDQFPVELFISPSLEEKLLASDLVGYRILDVNEYL